MEDSDSYEPLSNINITPFVDILLVLLVVFMITAPVITYNIEVNLPEESLRSSSIIQSQKFVISINKKKQFSLNGKKLGLKKLLQKAINWNTKRPQDALFIRADKDLPYASVIHLMSELKNIGITNIGLLVMDKDRN